MISSFDLGWVRWEMGGGGVTDFVEAPWCSLISNRCHIQDHQHKSFIITDHLHRLGWNTVLKWVFREFRDTNLNTFIRSAILLLDMKDIINILVRMQSMCQPNQRTYSLWWFINRKEVGTQAPRQSHYNHVTIRTSTLQLIAISGTHSCGVYAVHARLWLLWWRDVNWCCVESHDL